MFGSNVMDGNLKVINVASLSTKTEEKKYDFGISEPSNLLSD
jgi:hypothetical protein